MTSKAAEVAAETTIKWVKTRAVELEQKLKAVEVALQEKAAQVQQQTEHIQSLITNIQKVVEDWSGKEAEWKRSQSSSSSKSSSRILLDVHPQIIKKYKESPEYAEEVNLRVANEFDKGFEYIKKLVQDKGLNTDEVGIIDP